MRRWVTWITLVCFVTTQTAAVAGPFDRQLREHPTDRRLQQGRIHLHDCSPITSFSA